jgi:hypothetical protein
MKFSTRLFAVTFLASSAIFQADTLHAMGSKVPVPKEGTQITWVPNLDAKKQETPSWCWAAATQMLLSRFTDQSPPAQCAIVGRALKTDCCDRTKVQTLCRNYGGEKILSTLRSYRSNSNVKYGVNFESVVRDMKSGYPVIVVDNLGGTQHALVAYGTLVDSKNRRTVIVWDPFTGRSMPISEDKAMWDYTLHAR